jgi:8-oxo-dGTP diphosphatase
MEGSRPVIGVGVIIVNKDGKILIGRRKGSHAQKFSIPGGHFELGETFEEAAEREVAEETGLQLSDPVVIAVTNNLGTYKEEGKHTISIILLAKKFTGEPQNMEPEKNEEWFWCDPKSLPEPHFDASRMGIQCYVEGKFYEKV